MSDHDQPRAIVEVSTVIYHERSVVVARGEIDLSNADVLREALEGMIATEAQTIVLDLLDLKFLDSTGLRVIIEGDRRASEAGGALIVVVDGGPVGRLFDLTGLAEVLTIQPELPEGLSPS